MTLANAINAYRWSCSVCFRKGCLVCPFCWRVYCVSCDSHHDQHSCKDGFEDARAWWFDALRRLTLWLGRHHRSFSEWVFYHTFPLEFDRMVFIVFGKPVVQEVVDDWGPLAAILISLRGRIDNDKWAKVAKMMVGPGFVRCVEESEKWNHHA